MPNLEEERKEFHRRIVQIKSLRCYGRKDEEEENGELNCQGHFRHLDCFFFNF